MSDWKPGDDINSPVENFREIPFESMDVGDRYRYLISTVIPRPIALVSTVNKEGVGNLAPYSFFNALSSNPACVMVSATPMGNGAQKHTLRNIQDTGEFVVNFSADWMIDPIAYCGAAYPDGVDEMEVVGLTGIPSTKVKPKRVKESPAHLECKLHSLVPIGDGSPGSTTLIIGEVVVAHIWDQAFTDGRVDPKKLSPLSRLGGAWYGTLGDVLFRQIPSIG